jgi:hypothetical protein
LVFSPKNEFLKKNDWLFIKDEKLGCSTCKKVGSLGVGKKYGNENCERVDKL